MKKIIFLFVISCSFIFKTHAQETDQEIVNQFFERYKEKPLEAVDYIFGTNEWMKRSADQIDNVKNQLDKILPLMGTYYGYELITKKNTGKNLILHSYLVKYDRQPLRFIFIFYRRKETWKILNFSFNDSLDDELEEAAKQNRN